MKKILTYVVPAAAVAVVASVVAFESACNNVGDCPASITPGGDCSGDNLECPYTLDTPSPACDGTTTQIDTSCTCTDGTWVCPDPVVCDTGDGGGNNDAATDDGGADANDDTGTGTDAAADTGADTGSDSGSDATTD